MSRKGRKNNKYPIGVDQGLVFEEPQTEVPFVPTTILGHLVPQDIDVQIYDKVSESLKQKIFQFQQENDQLTEPVRAWDIFIADDRGAIRPADRSNIELRPGIQVVPSSEGTPSQTIAKAYYTSSLITAWLRPSGVKRTSGQGKSIKADFDRQIQEIEQKIARTPRESLGTMKNDVDTKLDEVTTFIQSSNLDPVLRKTLNLLIGANTLVKSASDAGQNSNAQEWMACSIIKDRRDRLMEPHDQQLGQFFNICDIVGMANISSDKLSILSSIAATKNYENPNDHTDGIFDSFCPRKGKGGREAVNIIPAVVWGAARLLGSEENITGSFRELYKSLHEAEIKFSRDYTESFRDTEVPLSSPAAGVSPVAPIDFFSHDMWNTYTAYFREIYMCAQTLKQSTCPITASAGSCKQNQEFSTSIADSLNIIEEQCKDKFLSGQLSEDTEYHLNEIFRLNNAFERFFMSKFDQLQEQSSANEYAYQMTFKFIRSILSCYGRYFTNIGHILEGHSIAISQFILKEQDVSVKLDTKYLQIAKTWYYHSGLQQYMQMSDEKIAHSILEKSKQTMKFMSIDGCLGHDFPFEKLKKTLLDNDIFTADEITYITNESDLVVKLLRKLGCVSVVSTEGPRGPVTICINTLNPEQNLLTSTETFSSIPIYKMFSGLPSRCNFTCLNIDYTSIQQLAGVQDLSMIFTLDETLDTMQQFMKETITFVFVTPSTKYDLAAPVSGCFLETGKQSTIFYARQILQTNQKLVLAFLTYDPSEEAKNDLELRRLGCLKKYVATHDFYTLEQLADFFEREKYKNTYDFRKLIDSFVENSTTMGIGNRGESANKTLTLCDDLLTKFYIRPDSPIKILLHSTTMDIDDDPCAKILGEMKKLFENLNNFREFSINKKGEVHKKNYKIETISFLNSLKELIGDSYIKYLSDKINEECFAIIQTILEYLVDSFPGSRLAKGPASMEVDDTDNKVQNIITTRKKEAMREIAEQTQIIQAFAQLKNTNRYGIIEQNEDDRHDDDRDADLLFDLFEDDEELQEKDEIVDRAASAVAEETGAVIEKLKELSRRYYNKLQSPDKESKIRELIELLNEAIAISLTKRVKKGGRKTRRYKNKTTNTKTRKHRKIKYKKYTRAYKLKSIRKTHKRFKK